MSGTLISSLLWVPRGKAAQMPKKYELNENELQRVGKMGGEGVLEKLRLEMEALNARGDQSDDEEDWQDEDSGSGSAIGSGSDSDEDGDVKMDTEEDGKPSDPNDLSVYKLDDYDDEQSRGTAMGAFSNIKGLSFYRDNNEDPYITLKEQDEDEREELEILPTDSVLLTARTTEDLSSLDFHVYDEANENLYVHHDLMLPSFPLCVEWLDFPCGPQSDAAHGKTGNYIAVGTFDPTIEIWDADLLDGLYPDALLGPSPSLEKPEPKPKGTGKKKKRIQVEPAANESHHVSAVLDLSWSKHHRNLLMSCSADTTIKLWDLTRESPQSAVRSWDQVHGGEKVQAVEWNKSGNGEMATVVLSGGWDRTVKVWDSRAVEEGVGAKVGSDIECVRWDPWEASSFYISLENGLILAYDARTLSSAKSASLATAQPKFTLSAHDGAASALDINPHIRGCIATGGMDKQVKVWNVNEDETAGGKREISLVTGRDLGVGKVFTVRWSPDAPLTLAAGGSKAKVQIWDVASNAGARSAFGQRLRKAGRELAEPKKGAGLVGVADDVEESDEE